MERRVDVYERYSKRGGEIKRVDEFRACGAHEKSFCYYIFSTFPAEKGFIFLLCARSVTCRLCDDGSYVQCSLRKIWHRSAITRRHTYIRFMPSFYANYIYINVNKYTFFVCYGFCLC